MKPKQPEKRTKRRFYNDILSVFASRNIDVDQFIDETGKKPDQIETGFSKPSHTDWGSGTPIVSPNRPQQKSCSPKLVFDSWQRGVLFGSD